MNSMQSMYGYPQVFQPQYQYASQPMQNVASQQYMRSQYFAVGVKFASSVEEVQNTITQFGQRTMFMDPMRPLMYVRDVDSNGVVSPIKVIKFEEVDANDQSSGSSQYVTIDQLNNAMKDLEAKYESVLSTANAAVAEPVHATATAEPVTATIIEPVDAAKYGSTATAAQSTGRHAAAQRAVDGTAEYATTSS